MRRSVSVLILAAALSAIPPSSSAVPGGSAETAPARRALLIGINDYLANDLRSQGDDPTEWIPQDLRGARNDVDLIGAVLRTKYGFEAADVETLVDRAATREAILSALRRLVERAGPDDVVYVHFSGHGSQVEDVSGDEARDGLDETILSYDARTDGVRDITDDEIGTVLAGLATRNAFVVLDSCHSGTATRGGPAVATRSVPPDPRVDLYRAAAAPATRGALPDSANYVLMTGAADFQSALDGPLNGKFYGFFSWALATSLGRAADDARPADVHAAVLDAFERIGAKFSQIRMPEPQLEVPPGLADRPLLRASASPPASSGTAAAPPPAPRLPFAVVRPTAPGRARLVDGVPLGGVPGSSWAIYPPGETAFAPGEALATGTVAATDGRDAVVVVTPDGVAVPDAARAVVVAPPPADRRVSVRLGGMDPARAAEVLAALRAAMPAIEAVAADAFARFVVDERDGALRLYGGAGMQELVSAPSAKLGEAAGLIAAGMARQTTVADLLSLENQATRLDLRVRALPARPDGTTRSIRIVGGADAPAYRARRPGERRTPANSLQLEIRVDRDVWLTVLHVDPAGEVAQLFPNPYSERREFLPGGRVAAGGTIVLPDSLDPEAGGAGFVWDLSAPFGLDTVQVFATTDAVATEEIREAIAALARAASRATAPAMRGGGETASSGPTVADVAADLRERLTTRGIRMLSAEDAIAQDETEVAAGTAAGAPAPVANPGIEPDGAAGATATAGTEPDAPAPPGEDWATATVTFVVEEGS